MINVKRPSPGSNRFDARHLRLVFFVDVSVVRGRVKFYQQVGQHRGYPRSGSGDKWRDAKLISGSYRVYVFVDSRHLPTRPTSLSLRLAGAGCCRSRASNPSHGNIARTTSRGLSCTVPNTFVDTLVFVRAIRINRGIRCFTGRRKWNSPWVRIHLPTAARETLANADRKNCPSQSPLTSHNLYTGFE